MTSRFFPSIAVHTLADLGGMGIWGWTRNLTAFPLIKGIFHTTGGHAQQIKVLWKQEDGRTFLVTVFVFQVNTVHTETLEKADLLPADRMW